MPLPHMAEAKAWSEQMCSGAFQFQIPALAGNPNYQVRQALNTSGALGTSQLTPTSTFSPINARVQVFCSPNGSVAAAAGNPNTLPRGMAAGTQTSATEYLVDLSGFPADIINVTANYIGTSRGPSALSAQVSCIDNVNKLVYIQLVNTTTGAAAVPPAGSIIACQVVFQDSYAV